MASQVVSPCACKNNIGVNGPQAPGGRGNGSAASDMMSLSTDSMVRDLDAFDGDGGFHNPLANEGDDEAAVAARGAAAGAGEGDGDAPAAPESV